MTQLEILKQAILAAPHDDVARLAFADEMEAIGKNEIAEYIRIEAMIAIKQQERNRAAVTELVKKKRRPPLIWSPFVDRRYSPWMDPDNYLYHLGRRLDETGPFKWSRGFINSVELKESTWVKFGPLLVADWPIVHVRFYDKNPRWYRSLDERPSWHRGSAYSGEIHPEIFDLMIEEREKHGGVSDACSPGIFYPKQTQAYGNLSAGAIRWAKIKAGMSR